MLSIWLLIISQSPTVISDSLLVVFSDEDVSSFRSAVGFFNSLLDGIPPVGTEFR